MKWESAGVDGEIHHLPGGHFQAARRQVPGYDHRDRKIENLVGKRGLEFEKRLKKIWLRPRQFVSDSLYQQFASLSKGCIGSGAGATPPVCGQKPWIVVKPSQG